MHALLGPERTGVRNENQSFCAEWNLLLGLPSAADLFIRGESTGDIRRKIRHKRQIGQRGQKTNAT